MREAQVPKGTKEAGRAKISWFRSGAEKKDEIYVKMSFRSGVIHLHHHNPSQNLQWAKNNPCIPSRGRGGSGTEEAGNLYDTTDEDEMLPESRVKHMCDIDGLTSLKAFCIDRGQNA